MGTSCMKPTKKRGQTSVFLSYGSEGILFDCGEGTQRQMKIIGVKPSKISKILISHWHGDHVLGLPGLLQTIASENPDKSLEIYGPVGTKKYVKIMLSSFIFDSKIDIKIKDVKNGKFFENSDFYLEARELEHRSKIIGFSFVEKEKKKINLDFVKKIGLPHGPLLGKLQQNITIKWKNKTIKPKDATKVVKGKKVTYITDTLVCGACFELANDSDILISESVYTSDLSEKAEKYKHLTAKDAALIASRSGVKKLVLIHFSQRYKNTSPLREDAKDYFNNVVCAEDFMKLKL